MLFFTLFLALPPARPAAESSELAPLAAHSLLLDVTRAGPRLVAVGDRGHVLVSTDEGVTWRQVIVPTRAMLTAVSFPDPLHGWAVGHDGVIIATQDGGETWVRQDAGDDLESVFLDVLFLDPAHGLAVGAYGLCRVTRDGGQTWTPIQPNEDELHFNALSVGPTGTLYLAGESGTLLTSHDQGTHWSRVDVPYEGSLYGLLPIGPDALIAYGLRGHVFVTADGGASWTEPETMVPVLIMAGRQLSSGAIVLAGLGGNFYLSRDGGAHLALWQPEAYHGGVSAVLEAADGHLIVAGENGVARLQLPFK